MNNMILIAVVLVVLIATGALVYFTQPDGTPGTTATTTAPALITYSNDKYGVSFTYPDTYQLTERDRGSGEREIFVVTLERKSDLPPPVNGEGPPAIEAAFYQNNLDNYTLAGWVTGYSASNFKQSVDGTYASSTVAGREALTYRWSGLYEGLTNVFIHKDALIAMSVMYLQAEDEIVQTYRDVLDSVRLR